MDKYGYDRSLSTGVVAAGGTLGIMIRPSSIFIIYGLLTEQSIGKLFIAGIVPGLLLAFMFIVAIYIQVRRNPMLAPRGPRTSLREKLSVLKDIWGALLLFLLVMGSIYSGVFTPTEAGGIGAFGAFILAVAKRRLILKSFVDALMSAIKTTAMAFIILIGAMIFGYFLAVSRVPSGLAGFVSNLPMPAPFIIALICFIYLILGCFIDSLPMVVLTVPIFYPVVVGLGYDPIWFGVLIVLVTEMGCITPPVGINVYVVAGVAKDVPMSIIFRGILPFLLMMALVNAILIIFPQVALFLPNFMMG
jgi:tripartite ATP-independent transporter DctM subunit